MGTTKIEWAEKTWSPMTGCTPISEGCKNCYAKRMALRLQAMGQEKYAAGFTPTFHKNALYDITPKQKPALIFVCSMADLFHKDVRPFTLEQIFTRMAICSQHRFMVLTKRANRMAQVSRRMQKLWYGSPGWPLPNVALGVTCENQARANERLPILAQCPAAYKFISVEPMLGPVDLDEAIDCRLRGADWELVICGGESGPGARPMNADWARSLRDECAFTELPFHFKQHGGVNKRAAGRLLDGVTHDGAINWRT